MENGHLLKDLRNSPLLANTGEIWWSLQDERGEVSRELLAIRPLCQEELGLRESKAANDREIEEWHRRQLDRRLGELNDALDRVMDGRYGHCTLCRAEIDAKRLVADPAASLCIACQRNADGETGFRNM